MNTVGRVHQAAVCRTGGRRGPGGSVACMRVPPLSSRRLRARAVACVRAGTLGGMMLLAMSSYSETAGSGDAGRWRTVLGVLALAFVLAGVLSDSAEHAGSAFVAAHN